VSSQTYLVGGTVRDLLLRRASHDWDVATGGLPGAVMAVFERIVPTGLAHGTVTVIQSGSQVEVTSLRREGPYADGRRPDYVEFGAALSEDLGRRDFTINAMAFGWPVPAACPQQDLRRLKPILFDPHGGLRDLAAGVVRAVGDPAQRLAEDHLRILRAYRIAAELDMRLDPTLVRAATSLAGRVAEVAPERIRAELDRMLLSRSPAWCLEQLRLAGVVEVVLPELAAGYGFSQNEFHPYDVWYHSIIACDSAPGVLHLRLAALLHDVGKPLTLTVDAQGRRHFYGHEQLSATMAATILQRLRYDHATIAKVQHLVARHMDLHDLPEDASDAAVRRAAARVGRGNISDLLHLREADRRAAGKQGAVSQGTLRLLARLLELDRRDTALAVTDLCIDGHAVMRATGLQPGPAVGRVLSRLLDAVLEDPTLNNPPDLLRLAELYAGQVELGR
jgi:tRNA nucleotidyltransferase/poly(A) polymerase